MTPKQKANELLSKYFWIYENYPMNKKSALITVHEMKEFFSKDIKYTSELEFWNQVESEIGLKEREILNVESQEARADRFNEELER